MFKINFSRFVIVAGCPSTGIEALDFRRANGLPETTNNIEKVEFSAKDEILARRLGELNENADLCFTSELMVKRPFDAELESGSSRYRWYAEPVGTKIAVAPSLILAVRAGNHDAVAEMINLWRQAEQQAREQYETDKATYSAEQQRLEEERERLAAEWAADLAKARELLAGELAAGAEAQKRLNTVSKFLSEVPNDALRGTIKRITASAGSEAAAKLMEEINDASDCVIFDEVYTKEDEDA